MRCYIQINMKLNKRVKTADALVAALRFFYILTRESFVAVHKHVSNKQHATESGKNRPNKLIN